MGVGVLIGHNSSSNTSGKGSAATPAITINGAGTANGSAAATTPTQLGLGRQHGQHRRSPSTAPRPRAPSKAPPKVVIQKAAAAASKVTGGSAKTAGATATQGSACTAGTAGCQNGKLTGNYFGQ